MNPGIMGACSVAGWLREGYRRGQDMMASGHALQVLSPTATKVGCAYVYDTTGNYLNNPRFPGCYVVACKSLNLFIYLF
jgi:hypothetical protein